METELKAFLDGALDRLVRANADRRSPFRLPVLASVGADGLADARTVVMRRFERQSSEIIIFSDARAKKIDDLSARPVGALTWWDKAASLQVRGRAVFRVETSGEGWARDLKAVLDAGAGDYISVVAPGRLLAGSSMVAPGPSGREGPGSGAAPDDGETTGVHFARLIGMLTELDVLYLARDGHRRAKFDFQTQAGWSGGWVQA